jgi:hypothetical protein
MRLAVFTVIFLALVAGVCPAQTFPSDPVDDSDASDASAAGEADATPNPDRQWAFSASAFTYIVPDDREYVQPTFTADRDWLHLEARYNYEDQQTGSAWVGYNFAGGDKFAWEVTPMLGGVFGDTNGVAPGFKGTLGWRNFELYSEGEYVFDTDDSSDNFFYTWSELTYSPLEWLRFGIAAQRTHAYDSGRDIQPGLLVGFTWNKLDLSAYVFNFEDDKPVVVIGIRFDF